jgi:hypothetical protein
MINQGLNLLAQIGQNPTWAGLGIIIGLIGLIHPAWTLAKSTTRVVKNGIRASDRFYKKEIVRESNKAKGSPILYGFYTTLSLIGQSVFLIILSVLLSSVAGIETISWIVASIWILNAISVAGNFSRAILIIKRGFIKNYTDLIFDIERLRTAAREVLNEAKELHSEVQREADEKKDAVKK